MMTRWMKILFLVFQIVLMGMYLPANQAYSQEMQSAQGVEDMAYGLTLDDAQIEEWLGRERRIDHPVVPNLETRDAATLHFYFSRTYGQRAESVIKTAQSAADKTLRFLPKETVENIHVYLLGDINEYFEAQNGRGRAPEWAAGLTILQDGVILIRLSSHGTSRIEPERTLAHELNHAALRRYVQDNYVPHWFYEGLAMLATDDWGQGRSETIARAAMSGHLLQLDELDPAFGKTGALVDLAYSQSVYFVTWLDKTYGDEAMKTLIAEVASGKSFDDAFIKAFGRSQKAAFSVWYQNMSRHQSILASIFSKDGLFFLISVFAAIGLCIALWRKRAIRKQRKESMNQAVPISSLPENLRHFGPFDKK